MERSLTREVVLGTGAAFAASKVMDRVTTAFQERQSEGSRRREAKLQDEPAFVKAAEKIAELRGSQMEPDRAREMGQRFHIGLGLSGGLAAGLLVARGMNPLGAGLLAGLGIWLLVDEAANATLGFTPPAPAFPRETHIRGLVGHLAYGAVLGGLLSIGNLVFRDEKQR